MDKERTVYSVCTCDEIPGWSHSAAAVSQRPEPQLNSLRQLQIYINKHNLTAKTRSSHSFTTVKTGCFTQTPHPHPRPRP